MKKNLVLNSLRVKSFITSLDDSTKKTIKGGETMAGGSNDCPTFTTCETEDCTVDSQCRCGTGSAQTFCPTEIGCDGGDNSINNSLNVGCTNNC